MNFHTFTKTLSVVVVLFLQGRDTGPCCPVGDEVQIQLPHERECCHRNLGTMPLQGVYQKGKTKNQ